MKLRIGTDHRFLIRDGELLTFIRHTNVLRCGKVGEPDLYIGSHHFPAEVRKCIARNPDTRMVLARAHGNNSRSQMSVSDSTTLSIYPGGGSPGAKWVVSLRITTVLDLSATASIWHVRYCSAIGALWFRRLTIRCVRDVLGGCVPSQPRNANAPRRCRHSGRTPRQAHVDTDESASTKYSLYLASILGGSRANR
jgi:hypothetical protein